MWLPAGMWNLQIQPKRLPHPSGGCYSSPASATRWAVLRVSSSLSATHSRRSGSGCARYLSQLRREAQTRHAAPTTELSTFKMLTALRSARRQYCEVGVLSKRQLRLVGKRIVGTLRPLGEDVSE